MSTENWKIVDGALERSFSFADFSEAFAFMTRVAMVAESKQHHPTWTNTYDSVVIRLSTHDAGDAVTEKDHGLAAAINKLIKE